jgi:hypothetical protein
MLAFTEEQVKDLAYGAVYEILENCDLGDEYDLTLERIKHRDSPGSIVPIAGAPSARDGARTTFQHFDEPHRMLSERLKQARRRCSATPEAARSERLDARDDDDVRAGEGSVSRRGRTCTRSGLARRGRRPDAPLRPPAGVGEVGAARREGQDQGSLRAAIREASGDAWAWTDVDAIVALFNDPTGHENEFRRYWLNQRRASSRKWSIVAGWDALKAARSRTARGLCSRSTARTTGTSTVLVGATVEERPHLFVVAAWEKPLLQTGPWRVSRARR